MAECEANHSRCQSDIKRQKGVLRGIRFLHLGDKSVRLHDNVQPERYGCLSHCWGDGKELCKTTVQNRTCHVEAGILIEKLPKTYRDAVIMCKKLGIGYLWIDSLCILQGDKEDWEKQASRMSDVYENAYVTIAAVGAQDASQGLFRSTPMSRTGSPLPGFPWIHVRQKVRLPETEEADYHTTTGDGWALYKRGWTFQELSLSPRVLHFGAEEVFWSCRTATACEGAPESDRRILERILVNLSSPNISSGRLWYRIIEGYSLRNLTFGKDKFPAIAAFATRFQADRPGNRYVAGLWGNTLLPDLLWACLQAGPKCEPLRPIRPGIIPSWSWASAKLPIRWSPNADYWQSIPCTEIMQITCNTRGSPILGDILEAFLVLRAPVIKLCKDYCKELGNYWKGVEGVPDHAVTLQFETWDHDRDDLKRAYRRGDYHYSNQLSDAIAIPLITMEPDNREMGVRNALLVAMKTPGVYTRAGVGRLFLLEELLDNSPKIPVDLRDKVRQSHEQWEGRFVHEMSRLERHVIKLV